MPLDTSEVFDLVAPPPAKANQFEHLFVSLPTRIVQSPDQSHQYKKRLGSSDAAKTYDTTAA